MPPATHRGRTRRCRKPPLDVEALWAIKRIGSADALAGRPRRLRRR